MNAAAQSSAEPRSASYSQAEAVSPLFAEIHAQYGAAFDAALARNVADALAEDVGTGDQTGRLVPADEVRHARVVVREHAVLCGVPWFNAVLRQVDSRIEVQWLYREGERMTADTPVCELRGPVRALLTAERNALNFLQLLSAWRAPRADMWMRSLIRVPAFSIRARRCPACGSHRNTRCAWAAERINGSRCMTAF